MSDFILAITTTPQFHRWDERCESQGKYLKDGAANNFHLNILMDIYVLIPTTIESTLHWSGALRRISISLYIWIYATNL